jgi:hypothetical protein
MAISALGLMGISAGVGALSNLFSGSGHKEYTLEDLRKYGYSPFDTTEAKNKLLRLEEARLKNKRRHSETKARSQGVDPVSRSNFAAEEGIHTATNKGMLDIDVKAREEKQRMSSLLMKLNAGRPEEEGWVSRALGGALTGAGLGANMAKVIGLGNEDPEDLDKPIKPIKPTEDTDTRINEMYESIPLEKRIIKENPFLQETIPATQIDPDVLPLKNLEKELGMNDSNKKKHKGKVFNEYEAFKWDNNLAGMGGIEEMLARLKSNFV